MRPCVYETRREREKLPHPVFNVRNVDRLSNHIKAAVIVRRILNTMSVIHNAQIVMLRDSISASFDPPPRHELFHINYPDISCC